MDESTATPPPPDPARHPKSRWSLPPLVVAALVAGMMFVAWVGWKLPIANAAGADEAPGIVFVDSAGKPFARRGFVREEAVDASKLPEVVTVPFIALEDRRFRKHMGVDLKAIARALSVNARAGGVVEGGSTITQQLAKTTFLQDERTFRRKVQEAAIAVLLERNLSKDQILSRYLSTVYFGDGAYGLRAAARRYFGKQPEELDVREAAMLAGLLKAPSRLAPTKNPEGARERYRVVLAAMVDAGALLPEDAKKLADSPPKVLPVKERDELPSGHWFADWIMAENEDALPRHFNTLTVQTTLDSKLQARAEETLRRILATQGRRMGATQGALVAMRPDGRVVALVGGRDYKVSVFNRATQAKRQPGSAFKLFVWAAALRHGLDPNTVIADTPLQIGNWTPANFENRYEGRLTLTQALARSSNVASARLTQWVGPQAVIDTARAYGVQSPLEPNPSLALGTEEVSLIELTSAYAAVFRGYGPVRPWGLAEAPPDHTQQQLPEAQALAFMLAAAAQTGTGRAARVEPVTFGKTGTSQDYRDAVFVGYARDLVVGVWVGNDDQTPMRGVTGGSLPAAIFKAFVSGAPERRGAFDVDALRRSLGLDDRNAQPEGYDLESELYREADLESLPIIVPDDQREFEAPAPLPEGPPEDDGYLALPPPGPPRGPRDGPRDIRRDGPPREAPYYDEEAEFDRLEAEEEERFARREERRREERRRRREAMDGPIIVPDEPMVPPDGWY